MSESMIKNETAFLRLIDRYINKQTVNTAAMDSIKKHRFDKNEGNVKLWEAYRLVLLDVEQELLATVAIASMKGLGYDVAIRAVWAHYPKSTTAWLYEYFSEEGRVQSLASRYAEESGMRRK